MNQTETKKIKVKDRNGDFNNWIVYAETEHTYKIYAECDRGYIAEIYKDKVWSFDYIESWYSDEIKNPFSLLPEWYAKAEFCEIRLDR
jgi:hypothetical protein